MKTKNWKWQKLLGMTLLLGFGQMLLSCNGTPTPSELTARKVFENKGPVKSLINEGAIRVNSFKKTNGQMTEVNGAKMYKMEFEAEIESLKDDNWSGRKKVILESQQEHWCLNKLSVAGKQRMVMFTSCLSLLDGF